MNATDASISGCKESLTYRLPKHIALRPAKLYAIWQEPHKSSSKLKKQPSATTFEKDTERTYRRLTEKFGLNQWPHPGDFINILETKGCDE